MQETVQSLEQMISACEQLVADWQRISRVKFHDAKQEETEFGRRLIEHGAMCYIGCMAELNELIECVKPTIGHSDGNTELPSVLGVKVLPAMGTLGQRAIGSVKIEPQNHLSSGVKTRLTQVMHRLFSSWFGSGGLSCIDDFQAINELSGSDLEQRVSLSLVHSILELSQFITRVAILASHIEQGRIVGEECILGFEQFAVHLRELNRHLIPVPQLDCSSSDIFSQSQGSNGGADH